MLSAAAGLVFLPTAPASAEATRAQIAQRQPANESSGTADKGDEAKSTVQRRIDEFYARFGRRPTTPEITALPAPELLAKSDTAKPVAPKPATPKSKATTPKAASPALPEIQQASAEFMPASREPGRLGETTGSRSTLESTRPATRASGSAGTVTPTAAGVRQVSANGASLAQSTNQTEVQRRLEEMYRKSGREMPPMQFNQLPEQNRKVLSSQQTQPQQSFLQSTPESMPQSQQQARPAQPVAQNRVGNFFKNISPFKPKENDERPKKLESMSPESLRQQQLLQQQTQPTPGYQNFNQGGAGGAVIPPTPTLLPSAPPADLQDSVTAPRLFMPENKDAGRALQPLIVSDLPEFRPAVQLPQSAADLIPKIEIKTPALPAIPSLPNLDENLSDAPFVTPVEVKKAVEAAIENAVEKPADALNDELGNSFPEMSETEADGSKGTAKKKLTPPKFEQPKSELAKPDATEDESPFTGLKLDASESGKAPRLPESSIKLPSPSSLTDDEGEDDDKEMTDTKPNARTPESGDPQADKLRKIAERAELKGFKGFCPVVLRDDRDLSDARPQFKAVFLGKVYNLSSAAAREKFEKNPKMYAPASGGMDIVMSQKDGTEVEGMLDHAAWFRDRLYLFSSAKTKADFEATPTKFVIE